MIHREKKLNVGSVIGSILTKGLDDNMMNCSFLARTNDMDTF